MRDIDELVEGLPKIGDTPMFHKTTYTHPQNGQEYPMYLMNRDGFTLLAMGFTGKAALEWKLKYIDAFNRMEQEIKQKAAKPLSTAQMFALQAQVNMEQEQRLAALEKRTDGVAEAFETLALPSVSKDEWQEQTNKAVRKLCTQYKLSFQQTTGDMHAELESLAGVNLAVRQKNMRERKKRGGAKYAECQAITKLSVVADDNKLREIYTGIVRRKAARLATASLAV